MHKHGRVGMFGVAVSSVKREQLTHPPSVPGSLLSWPVPS